MVTEPFELNTYEDTYAVHYQSACDSTVSNVLKKIMMAL